MDSKEVISTIRGAVERVKADGGAAIDVEKLLAFLTALENSSGPSMELARMRHQAELASFDAQNKSNLEAVKWAIDAGKDALQALMVICGASVLALMTFLGTLVSKPTDPRIGLGLVDAMTQFGIGVLLAALGFGLRYLAQFTFAWDFDKAGKFFNAASVLSAIAGYGLFVLGVYGAADAIRVAFPPH